MPAPRAPCDSARPSPRRPRPAAAAAAASCSRACRRPSTCSSQSRTGCLSRLGGLLPSTTLAAGQKRDESGVSTSSISVSVPASSRPNSNLVSAMTMPARRARTPPPRCRGGSRCRAPSPRGRRRRCRSARAKSMFSSWSPISALVAGVKIGAGSFEALLQARRQHARRTPRRSPGTPSSRCRRGSRARPPRSAAACSRLTSIERPRTCVALVGGDDALRIVAGEVVRHDVAEAREPEQRHLRQHAALARDRLAHDDVERAQPVARDHQHAVAADRVVVAHLAARDQRQRVEAGSRSSGASSPAPSRATPLTPPSARARPARSAWRSAVERLRGDLRRLALRSRTGGSARGRSSWPPRAPA